MTKVRETKRADELVVGDWTAPGGISALPAEVLHTLTYPHPGDGGIRTHLVLREFGIPLPFAETYQADKPIGIATAEELESIRAGADRARQIADIRALADWLEANPDVPMAYGIGGQADLSDSQTYSATEIDAIRAFAGQHGGEFREGKDHTSARVRFGGVTYSLITWHKDGRPVDGTPTEQVPEREDPWFEVGDRVTPRGWETSQYARAGLNTVGTVVETKPIAGSLPLRQQFRAEGADWCGGSSMWCHSDSYEPANPVSCAVSTPHEPHPTTFAPEMGIANGQCPGIAVADEAHVVALTEDNDRAKAAVLADLRDGEDGRVANPNLARFLAVKEDARRYQRHFLGLEESAKHFPKPADAD